MSVFFYFLNRILGMLCYALVLYWCQRLSQGISLKGLQLSWPWPEGHWELPWVYLWPRLFFPSNSDLLMCDVLMKCLLRYFVQLIMSHQCCVNRFLSCFLLFPCTVWFSSLGFYLAWGGGGDTRECFMMLSRMFVWHFCRAGFRLVFSCSLKSALPSQSSSLF